MTMVSSSKIVKIITALFVILVGFGCEKPSPIELIDQRDDANLIELKTVGTIPDTIFTQSGADSTGLIGLDQVRCYGKMVFSRVVQGFPSRDSLIHMEAIFLDKANPIQYQNRIVAYPSLDVGSISLNTDTLQKIERKIMLGNKDTLIGYRYILSKNYNYQFSSQLNWIGSGKNDVQPFNIQFTLAPEIRVVDISPRYISVSEPIQVKWHCSNQSVNIIISREGKQLQRKWIPIFQLKVNNVRGQITIPTRILELLPTKRYQKYLFTFTSETQLIKNIVGYPDDILVHSASIHNIILDVRQ